MHQAMEDDRLKLRLEAIAINSIRESQIAHGRGDQPWIDDDVMRKNHIYSTLFIYRASEIEAQNEHFPLASAVQAPINPAVEELQNKLAEALKDPLVVRKTIK